jgi:4-hydroxy-tetrahydrodipicolinate synthase
MAKRFTGVFTVVCTPFDQKGEVDEAALRRHIRYQLDECRVHNIIPVGSTGEFAFLSEEERKRVVAITLDEVKKKVPVIVGSAACATREMIAYAQSAQKAGADGVMVVPSYYGHLSQEELYYHFSTLAKNLDIPIVLYNNPGTSGSDMLPPLIARLAEFDNIKAVKESTGIMQRVAEIMRLCGDKLEVLCGCDTLAFEMFNMGVEGWIAAPANVIAKQCVALYELAVVKKDYARAKELYFHILPVFDLFENSGAYVQLAKAGLEMMGRGIGEPRKPLLPPSEELTRQLKDTLELVNSYAL